MHKFLNYSHLAHFFVAMSNKFIVITALAAFVPAGSHVTNSGSPVSPPHKRPVVDRQEQHISPEVVVSNPGNVNGQERPRQILLLKMTCSKVQIMASTATMRIIPRTAACILSLAAVMESLSPPDEIHANAPSKR